MFRHHPFIFVITVFLSCGCHPKEEAVLEPLPALSWQESEMPAFNPESVWENSKRDWSVIGDALRFEIHLPEALETKLEKSDRELWRSALTHIEESQIERKEAQILSNLQVSPAVACEPPSSGFSLQQRAQLQLTLQLHRNVLWRIGRLEMATRGVHNELNNYLALFSGGRIKDADVAVIEPVRQMVTQIEALRSGHAIPKGDWMPGDFQPRAARTTHLESIFIHAMTFFESWSEQMKQSDRWLYLSNAADPLIRALQTWSEEFELLIRAYRSLASHIQKLERDFAPPHSFVAWPCINQNLKRIRIISDIYSHILPMQWALSKAEDEAYRTYMRLQSPAYAKKNHVFLSGQIEQLINEIEAQKVRLTRCEDLLLIAWDESSRMIWRGLPEFIDPIHHHTKPAVESAETWNLLYQDIKNDLAALPGQIQAEPEQPLKNGKPLPAFISTVLEMLHAPSRIDEAERSLLAISELESHMVSIRDELLKLCKQGACRSFPEAELAHSPRKSAWIVSWRQSPANERTLGHSLIVMKLCQLHLSRLVQRLAEIYAWFSETSNADLAWKKLKSWQRIWTLYAEPNGTYASFLRSVASLDQSISDMAQPQTKRAESDNLLLLLQIQDRFFDLTLDYARFVDGRNQPPVSFDELISTWELIDSRLSAIEKVTVERDQALHPELNTVKRKVVDIPR